MFIIQTVMNSVRCRSLGGGERQNKSSELYLTLLKKGKNPGSVGLVLLACFSKIENAIRVDLAVHKKSHTMHV